MEDQSSNQPGSAKKPPIIQAKKPSIQGSTSSIVASPHASSQLRLGEIQKQQLEEAKMALEFPDGSKPFSNNHPSQSELPLPDSFVQSTRFRGKQQRMPVTSTTSPPLVNPHLTALVSPSNKTVPKNAHHSGTKSNPVAIYSGKNKQATTQSHRVQQKLRQQSNMASKLHGLQQYQTKQVTEAGVQLRNNNNSPMMTMQASTDKSSGTHNVLGHSTDANMKQSKTRNNLQSHVISTSTTKPHKAVVGQPYIAFKQQQTIGVTSKSGRSKFESLERSSQAYQKQQQTGNTTGKSGRYQAQTSIKLKQDQLANQSMDSSDLVYPKFQSNPHHSLRAKQKSSFSKDSSSNRAAEYELGSDGGVKCPQIVPANQVAQSQQNGEVEGRSGSTNFVVTTSAKSSKLNFRDYKRKHQKSQWALGVNANVSSKPTQTFKVHRNGGGDYEDLPIVISDQNPRHDSFKMPQIVSSASRAGEKNATSFSTSHRQQSLESPQSKKESLHDITPLRSSIGLLQSIDALKVEPSSRTVAHQILKQSGTNPQPVVTAGNEDTASVIMLDKFLDDAQTVQPMMNTYQMSPEQTQESSLEAEMEANHTQDSYLGSCQSALIPSNQKQAAKTKNKLSLRNEAAKSGATSFIKDKQEALHPPSLDVKETFYEKSQSRTSKYGMPYEKSALSLRSTINNAATSKIEASKERQYLLHRQMINSKQTASMQSHQFKKNVTKDSVRLEPITNTRYQKATLFHNNQKGVKESQEGSISTRRNISQLSQNLKEESTSQSLFKGYGKKQRDKTSGVKSGLQRHDGINKSLRQIRTKESNDYYSSTKIPAGKKLTSLDTASNRLLKAGFNSSAQDQDELMLIQQDNSQAVISTIKHQTEANHNGSDEDQTSSLNRGGRGTVVEMLDLSSEAHLEQQSVFNNSVVTTQTNQRSNNRHLFRTNDDQKPGVAKKDASVLKRTTQVQDNQRWRRKQSQATLENLPYAKSNKIWAEKVAAAEKKKLQKGTLNTLRQSPSGFLASKNSPSFSSLRKDARQTGQLRHQLINRGVDKSQSPSGLAEKGNKRQVQQELSHKFVTKTEARNHQNESSIGMSSSVASLPKIVGDEKGSKSINAASGRRLGSHRPSYVSMIGKLSLPGDNQSPRLNQQEQHLKQRPQNVKQPLQMLTPRNQTKFQQYQQAKTNKILRKSTQSFRSLKNERRSKPEEPPTKETRFQSPKQKRRVSIKEVQEKKHTYESPANRTRKPAPLAGTVGYLSKHTKSNSVALSSNLTIKASNEHDLRSMSTSIQQQNHSLRNEAQRNTLDKTSVTMEVEPEHQIRIEISKTEVLDAMKKEHKKDLSLLYYDFNNSKARLMSKMKKMSDFVIQEEAEADGDLPQPAASQSNVIRERKRQDGSMKKTKIDSPLSAHPVILKKQQSNIQIETTSAGIKHLEIPNNLRSSGLMSSHYVTLNDTGKTQMDLINQKIQKAKESISQLNNEGLSLSLQSPVRLAGSRNSSTKTVGQYNQIEEPGSNQSSSKKVSKKLFLFNQQTSKAEESSTQDLRNKSPCFGSMKNSQGGERQSSQSMQSLLQAIPLKQNSQVSDYQNQAESNPQNGSTGATEMDANFGILATSQAISHGMGTGFQTSLATRDTVKKKVKGEVSGIFVMNGSPVPTSTNRRSVQIEESELAILSSHQMSKEDSREEVETDEEQQPVTSVVQFVKENKQIWE